MELLARTAGIAAVIFAIGLNICWSRLKLHDMILNALLEAHPELLAEIKKFNTK